MQQTRALSLRSWNCECESDRDECDNCGCDFERNPQRYEELASFVSFSAEERSKALARVRRMDRRVRFPPPPGTVRVGRPTLDSHCASSLLVDGVDGISLDLPFSPSPSDPAVLEVTPVRVRIRIAFLYPNKRRTSSVGAILRPAKDANGARIVFALDPSIPFERHQSVLVSSNDTLKIDQASSMKFRIAMAELRTRMRICVDESGTPLVHVDAESSAQL